MVIARYMIEIPPEVIHTTRMTPEEMKIELALSLFQRGKISFGKAREMSALSVWDFQQLLGRCKIEVHYDLQDYQIDQTAIDTFTQK